MASLAPGDLTFEVAEPLPDVYRVADRRAETEQADVERTVPVVAAEVEAEVVTGERLYRPFVLGVVTEESEPAEETAAERTQQLDVITTIDLTAYDETTEFSVGGLRSARHSA